MDTFRILLLCILICVLLHITDSVNFNNLPHTAIINENYDSSLDLRTVSATCYPSTNDFDSYGNLFSTIPHTVECEYCEISSNPEPSVFGINGKTIYKKSCSTTSCGNHPSTSTCSNTNGCLNTGDSFTIQIRCYTLAYDNDDSGYSTLTVSVTGETPALVINLPATVYPKRTMSQGTVLFTVGKTSGPDITQYRKTSSVSNSYQLNTVNLFDMDPTNGNVYIATNPSLEFDYTYTMDVYIYSRRQNSCGTLTLQFDGCFQTPNCNNQTSSFTDQHAVGDTLFTMTYQQPSAHFASINSTWQGLNFEIIYKTLNEASINLTSGVMSTTGNVTVWPAYPSASHTVTVKVTNPSESCTYFATCTMSFTFSFTNWPIRFESLPSSSTIHEDRDALTVVHSIITYDYNNPAHDNVTCSLIANEDNTLIELYHNGGHAYNSYSIRKKACQTPNCGYLASNFLCQTGIGCMNYDLKNSYSVTVKCDDFYGYTASANFVLYLDENDAPTWRNVPSITINTDRVSVGDVIFSIFYNDVERESLTYNFTETPVPSPALFSYDTYGNYYDNAVNITAIRYQWDLDNTTYVVTWSAYERRNMVHSSLTINLRDFCGPTPRCSDASKSVTDQGGAMDLFDLQALLIPDPTGGTYTSLTYRITSLSSGLFSVNSSSGKVKSLSALPVKNPPASTTYSIVAYVYDTAACGYGTCSLIVEVTFTNFDISITNVDGETATIHEDQVAAVTLITIQTSDANTNDDVTCYVDDSASVPADTGIFSAIQTYRGSNIWQLVSRESPGFDYDTRKTYSIVVKCSDKYGSSDTATMTVNITDNQAPVMVNLPASKSLNLDPMLTLPGDVLFTLTVTDVENDDLDYSCTVDTNYVPMECKTDGVVTLRRSVLVPDEDGATYDIVLCVNDSSHNHYICKTISFMFTSSKANPEISNLPDTVHVDEDTSIGTTLFTVNVTDPDANEIRTLSMDVYPSSSAFYLNPTGGEITLQSSLDYEKISTYYLVVSVKDPYLLGLEDKVLTIVVNNVNEQPTLTLTQTTFDTIEESAGYLVATIPYTCTDVDAGETLTLIITGGTHASDFDLDPTTGDLTFTTGWDFESDPMPPQTTSLDIACDDGHNSTDGATIVVNIAPKNEHAPVLDTDAENITIYINQTLIDPLLVITATDDDFGFNGIFEFKIVGDGKGSSYLRMNRHGQLFLSQYIKWNYNFTFYFTVKVSDGEDEPLTSSVDVIVTYIAPEYVEPTKEHARCILCTSIGRAVVIGLSIEAIVMLALFIHISVRMKIWEICQLRPKNQEPNVTDLQQKADTGGQNDKEEDDPYRPGSEMLNRFLPCNRPPSSFHYHGPSQITSEPPPAAEYLPPETDVVNLATISDPTEQTVWNWGDVISQSNLNFASRDSINNTHVNVIPKMITPKHVVPSLFQETYIIPPKSSSKPIVNKDNLYIPTVKDQSAALEARASKHARLSPLFEKPSKSLLYSERRENIPSIDEPANALNF